jgi:hypothetical protein
MHSRASRVKCLVQDFFLKSNYLSFRKYGVPFLLAYYSDVYRNVFFERRRTFRFGLHLIKYFPLYISGLFVSILAILVYILFNRKRTIAFWSGDFYSSTFNFDFRVGDFYNQLSKNNVIIDFIRIRNTSYKKFFQNIVLRKRLVVYYDAFSIFLTPFTLPLKFKSLSEAFGEDTLREMNQTVAEFSRERSQYYTNLMLVSLLRVEKFILWEVSSRQVYLYLACKRKNIPTFGFMHGLSFNTYMSYEFLDFQDDKFSPDIYIVWSKFWEQYHLRNSRMYTKILPLGYLRKKNEVIHDSHKNSLRKVLYICEPLIHPSLLVYRIQELLNLEKISVTFKLRDEYCSFYRKLIAIDSNCVVYPTELRSFSDCINDYDLCIGSHSTAVVEASLYNIPFLSIRTDWYGNYFELKDDELIFLVDFNENILDKILHLENFNYTKILRGISDKYFGTENSINQFVKCIEN